MKYLSAQPADHPDAVTPEGVARLVESSVPVYYDDDAVARLLEPLGWRTEEVSRRTATLAQWLNRYDNHVFLLAGSDAKAVGTGAWAYVRRDVAGARTLETDLRALTRRPVPQLLIGVAPARREITINRRPIVTAPEGGVAAVVVDPDTGTMIDIAAFPPGGGEAVTWRLRRIVRP